VPETKTEDDRVVFRLSVTFVRNSVTFVRNSVTFVRNSTSSIPYYDHMMV